MVACEEVPGAVIGLRVAASRPRRRRNCHGQAAPDCVDEPPTPQVVRDMTFTVYALLTDRAPALCVQSLASELETFFRGDAALSLTFEQLPFAAQRSLALRWEIWLARISYEEGARVEEDSREIALRTGIASIAGIGRRVRVVFGSDDAQAYTNQIIYLLDFLKAIDGVLLFDPQQNDWIA